MINPSMVFSVFVFGMISALATGIGALPLYFRKQAEALKGTGQAVAAALMTIAGLQLILEAADYSYLLPVLGAVAGVILIIATDTALNHFPDVTEIIESDNHAGARKGFLIIFIMTVHSAAEGVGIGVSFGSSMNFGVLIALTIALHNIPEGLAIALITVPRGMGVLKSVFWSIGTSLPQPLIGVVSYVFVTIFRPILPFGLGLAAGAMFWMVGSELLPEAYRSISTGRIITVYLCTGVLFFGLLLLL